MTTWHRPLGLALGLGLSALPAAAREPCIHATEPGGIALEDSIEAEVAAARAAGLYRETASYWSPDFALGGMVRVEATERGTAAAGTVRAALPLIDAALARAEAGARIAEAGNAGAEIVIRLVDSANPATPEAWSRCDGLACMVELFPVIWDGTPPEQLQFTLAHETFHVVQQLAYPAVDQCASYWWVEGTAEWFANLAVSGQDFSVTSGFLPGWDRDSPIFRLIDLDYEAVAFWFWAAERFGTAFPLGLGEFGNPGLDNTGSVAGLMSPADWADLLVNYLGGALAYPDGRAALRDPDPGPVVTPSGDAYTLGSNALTFPRAQLRLGPGLWGIRRSSGQPGSVAVAHDPASGDWTQFLADGDQTSVFFGCSTGGSLRLGAAGGPGAAGTQVAFAIEQSGETCSACWHGTWELTGPRRPEDPPEHVAPWLRYTETGNGYQASIRGDEPARIRHAFAQEGPHLTLRPDGAYVLSDPKTVTVTMSGTDGPVTTTTVLETDARVGRYEVEDGLFLHREQMARSRGIFEAVTPLLSFHQRFEEEWSFVEHLPQGFRMTCAGAELLLENAFAPSPDSTRVFRRID